MERFLREEKGFSLPEMVTTIFIMIVVFFALHSIFDMSMRVFAFGNNKAEAIENARIGLEKMEREIRAAYPVDGGDLDNLYLFFDADGSISDPPPEMPFPNQITFGNELGAGGAGDGIIECPDAANCEYITYKLSAPSNAPPCTSSPCSTLLRVNTDDSTDTGDPVAENVVPGGLDFTYYASDGAVATTEDTIDKVVVRLEIAVAPGTDFEGTQELTTEIDLRNR